MVQTGGAVASPVFVSGGIGCHGKKDPRYLWAPGINSCFEDS
jgi:hypothetical protein